MFYIYSVEVADFIKSKRTLDYFLVHNDKIYAGQLTLGIEKLVTINDKKLVAKFKEENMALLYLQKLYTPVTPENSTEAYIDKTKMIFTVRPNLTGTFGRTSIIAYRLFGLNPTRPEIRIEALNTLKDWIADIRHDLKRNLQVSHSRVSHSLVFH